MLKWHPFYSVLIVCIFILAIAGCLEPPMPDGPEKAESVVIRPDYSGVTIPPNIAPLNFKIQHPADACFVKVFSDSDEDFRAEILNRNKSSDYYDYSFTNLK